MNNELVSVIVPCYNGEKDIGRCLNSIINQTYNNLEIIVVDDGSKDDSKSIIKKYEKKDKRVHYFYKENGGLSSARNYGIDNSKGKYLVFIDSDDYVSNKYVEKLYFSIKENKTSISICDIKREYKDHLSINKMNKNIIDCCIFPAAWNKMYKASLFKKVKFPVGKWYEDLGTTPKLTLVNNYSIVNESLYNYVQNSSSIMHTYDDRIYDIYSIVEDLEVYLKSINKYDTNIEKIEFINIYHILIGTVYRCSFMKKFCVNDIKKIHKKIENKYPTWRKNKYIKKNLGIIYKMYLTCINLHFYILIYFMLKLFNKRINL